MKPNLFFYLSAGFNVGAISSLLIKSGNSSLLPSKKEIVTLVLSGLAAASAVGYLFTDKKRSETEQDEDYIDTRKDTAKKMETLLV